MALVVEDGTGLAGAESYLSVAGFQAFATARGYVISGDVTELESALRLATTYIDSFWNSFKGNKVSQEQALQWPRSDVSIFGFTVEEDELPQTLLDATAEAAYQQQAGTSLLPSGVGGNVKFEKVGPLETEYFSNNPAAQPTLRAVDTHLSPLLRNTGLLTSVRV